MNKKRKKIGITFTSILLVALCVYVPGIEAYDFSDETYWVNLCSGYITNQSTYNACVEFQKYAKNKANDYSNSAKSIQDQINEAEGNIDKLAAIGESYQNDINAKENSISLLQTGIDTAQASIVKAEADIELKQKNIKKRKKLIAKQMVDMQADINTNQFIDFIMGATDLVDLVQRSSGVESITKNQKEQIDTLNKEKKQLTLAKKEQKRIKETLKTQQDSIEVAKAELENLKAENDAAKEQLESEVTKMIAAKNAANSTADTLANMSPPQFTITGGGGSGGGSADVGDINSNGLMAPIQGCSISRGIQVGHRGVDWGAGWGTQIIAPADCYVIFATNIFTNDSASYNLGNTDGPQGGAPIGGGNSVRIIFSLNGQTFAMNFHHMTTSMPAVNYNGTGQVVKQGTVLGHVGCSGNTWGAHAHVEMFQLNGTVQQEIARWYATGDWQSGAGWGDYTPSCGNYGCRIDPLSYF